MFFVFIFFGKYFIYYKNKVYKDKYSKVFVDLELIYDYSMNFKFK